jgi:hypothetical protein
VCVLVCACTCAYVCVRECVRACACAYVRDYVCARVCVGAYMCMQALRKVVSSFRNIVPIEAYRLSLSLFLARAHTHMRLSDLCGRCE